MMKKQLCTLLLTAILFFSFLTPLTAQEGTSGLMLGIDTATYFENGAEKKGLTKPALNNAITWVPLRLATEYLGKTVAYNESDKTATITDAETGDWIQFNRNTNIAATNGEAFTLQQKPFIQDGCYMVPVRVLSEYFKAGVYWDSKTKGVLILKSVENEETPGLLMRYQDKFYFENGVGKTSLTRVEMMNGTSYLPLRIVSEYLGAKVAWNATDGSATLTMEGTEKWLTLSQKTNVITTNEKTFTIERNPFIQDDCYMVPVRVISEFFGCSVVWKQEYMSFLITKTELDAESEKKAFTPLDNLLSNVNLLATSRNTIKVSTNSYGKSGQGRDLTYTTIQKGSYSKTVMLVFAQHGFEDNYARDGQVLVNLANSLIDQMKQGSSALEDCRLIVVPCANPDGIAAGYTNNGPGRCTVVGGVDMNRDWPTSNYTPRSEARYKTTKALSCAETQNLYNLITQEQPSMLLDIHGWLNTTYGDTQIGNLFKNNLSLTSEFYTFELTSTEMEEADEEGISYAAADNYASGYLMRWAQEQGMRSALIELKSPYSINSASFIRTVEQCMKL